MAMQLEERRDGRLPQLVFCGLSGQKGNRDVREQVIQHSEVQNELYFWCKQNLLGQTEDISDVLGNLQVF